ncbi:NDP-sugar pyrophosphorylase family protein [Alkaliphilus hydrothermalis]|uniref:NDP-sugar pyrophosphorylase family protein n=1 Tax=Alkaliphilus hydrothermalis TaxID=1482730 RepID=A0ABS2NLW8_9FIRM|nr:NDP-sugar pyrophosphorylase family protein [Alkaliphilus hydrothermalis]
MEITDAIQEVLIEGYQIGYFMMEEHWLDVGTPEDLLYANKKQLTTITPRIEGGVDEKTIVKGNIIIEKGARVVNSVLEGPVYIGKDTIIQDSIIKENTCIRNECRIIGSKIIDSLIISEVNMYHLKEFLSNCNLGNNSVVKIKSK